MAEIQDRLHGLLPHIVGMAPPLQFAQVLSACCRQFSLSWYLTLHEQRPVVVPDDAPSINAAINRLGQPGASATNGHGLVLVRPGTYAESVRVTRNCYLLGLGGRGKVVVEAPGWESALVFSGLGVRSFGSGEDACVANITFRCRNELMRGRCVYIVLGQPTLECCDICGGVQVAGRNTAPDLRRCRVHGSWGSGLHHGPLPWRVARKHSDRQPPAWRAHGPRGAAARHQEPYCGQRRLRHPGLLWRRPRLWQRGEAGHAAHARARRR